MPDRRAKLEAAQREHRRLGAEIKELQDQIKPLMNRKTKLIAKRKSVGQAIYDLKYDGGNMPEITDHAIVRYLERVEGRDVQELRLAVAQCKRAYREGNVIVTVLGPDDAS